MQDKTDKKKQNNHSSRSYMKYVGMVGQMGGILVVGMFSGRWLDQYFGTDPILIVIFALLSIFAALYLTLKDFL